MSTPLLLPEHQDSQAGSGALRERIYGVMYRDDTVAGRIFSRALIVTIVISSILVMLDTVESIHAIAGVSLTVFEWVITVLFTLEYAARLYCLDRPWRYARSFFGIVDLLALLPTWLSLLFAGTQYLLVIRLLRLLRIFRIFRLVQYVRSAGVLMQAVRDSWHKIAVFYMFVLVMVTIFGSLMYVVEGQSGDFSSIPMSIYWAIVTVTTTGYGDLVPQTVLGKAIASLVMITGYAIIAVPTGIYTAELFGNMRRERDGRQCRECGEFGHEVQARYCHHCGSRLVE